MPEKIVALICAHNESASIGPLVDSLVRLRQNKTGLKKLLPAKKFLSKVVVVDDGSTDRTALIARLNGARVIRLSQNNGKTTAFYEGIRSIAALKPTILLMLDADLEPVGKKQVEQLLEPVIAKKAHMTKGDLYGDVVDLTGQRAIRFEALRPLLNHNPKWEHYFGLRNGRFIRHRQYGLETALNINIRNSEDVHTQFRSVRRYGEKTPTQIQDRQALRMVRVYHGRYRLAQKIKMRRAEKKSVRRPFRKQAK